MAQFVINTPISTNENTIEVTLDPSRPLAIGRHVFQLVVRDDSGNVSIPDAAEVIVADQSAPTAVIKAPRVVPSGQSFVLDGSRSFDLGGGTVVSYVWTYVGPAP